MTEELSATKVHTQSRYGSQKGKIMYNQYMIYSKRGSTGSIDGLEVIQQHQADEIYQHAIHSMKDQYVIHSIKNQYAILSIKDQ